MLRVAYEMAEQRKTQTDLSEELKINRGTVNRIVNGWEKPRPEYKAAIASALRWEGDPDLLFEIITPS